MKKKILVLGSLAVLAFVIVSGCTSTTKNPNGTNTITKNTPQPQQYGDEILIPLTNITTTASFLSYDDNGVTIRYFVVNDRSGNPHVAFDACDVCYEAKKGYKQVGDEMQCLNCGRQFSITSIGTQNTAGGCWPSYLPMTINGTNIVIKIADLTDKSYMF